ncbi:MAG: hypothetical protein PHN31_02495 [Candidatus Gracilibacteria bacterium]|nr:hypothetical protein [Candidatus Gracilibacteria bacterium]
MKTYPTCEGNVMHILGDGAMFTKITPQGEINTCEGNKMHIGKGGKMFTQIIPQNVVGDVKDQVLQTL